MQTQTTWHADHAQTIAAATAECLIQEIASHLPTTKQTRLRRRLHHALLTALHTYCTVPEPIERKEHYGFGITK